MFKINAKLRLDQTVGEYAQIALNLVQVWRESMRADDRSYAALLHERMLEVLTPFEERLRRRRPFRIIIQLW